MQNNIKSVIVSLIVVVLVVVGVVISVRSSSTTSQAPVNVPANIPAVTPAAVATSTVKVDVAPSYTLADVSQHSSVKSCWTVVRTNVYDVTKWISQHPGGQKAILGMCGRDATSAFEGKHGGKPRPEQELKGFEIGVLVK